MGPVAKSSEKRRAATAEKTGEKPAAKGGSKGAAKDKGREKDGSSGSGHPDPERGTGNTRVNLALPFSKIEVQEPSTELVELATLLSELVGALAEWVPEETLGEIRLRTEALCARLSP